MGEAHGDLPRSRPKVGPAPAALVGGGEEGPRPPSPQPLSGLSHPCPSFPGIWKKERDGAQLGWGPLRGPSSCRVSTEKSDAVRESWKQAGERWDVEGAAEPQVPGLPRSHPAGPTVRGQGGGQETRGRTSQCPGPTLAPPRSRTAPPTGLQGAPTAQPHPGVNTEPFETSKAQAGLSECGGGGGSKSMTLGRRAPQTPLLGGAPHLLCPLLPPPAAAPATPAATFSKSSGLQNSLIVTVRRLLVTSVTTTLEQGDISGRQSPASGSEAAPTG